MTHEQTSILHETENGYVAKCNCCNKFKIAFGNIALRYDQQGFQAFMDCIEGIDTNRSIDKPKDQKHYALKLPSELSLRFTQDEIVELKELLQWAYASCHVNDELL